MAVRIDKYLWSVRLFKTRSIATDAVNKGKVTIGGKNIKAARSVTGGDQFEVKLPVISRTYLVVEELEKRVGAKLVEKYLKEITPASELEKLDVYNKVQSGQRDRGMGRPTKKDRRDLGKIQHSDWDNWDDDDQ